MSGRYWVDVFNRKATLDRRLQHKNKIRSMSSTEKQHWVDAFNSEATLDRRLQHKKQNWVNVLNSKATFGGRHRNAPLGRRLQQKRNIMSTSLTVNQHRANIFNSKE